MRHFWKLDDNGNPVPASESEWMSEVAHWPRSIEHTEVGIGLVSSHLR